VIPVVADADTLFGATTRGLLIHLDYQGLIRLHWSPLILGEMSRALVDILAACSALERHQDEIVGLKPLLAMARRACGAAATDTATSTPESNLHP